MTNGMRSNTTQRRLICLGLLLITVTSLAYVCVCDFITLDDPAYVTSTPPVHGGLTWDNLRWVFTDSYALCGFFYPVTWLSFQLDASIFGPQGAWGFHLVNLLLHTASVMLLFLVLERMTTDLWRSAAVAALFAIHPLRVESVAWITERKDTMGLLFVVLTLTAYCWYVESPSYRRYLVLFMVFVLGLTAKVILITLPFALLLLDYWPLHRLRLGQAAPTSRNVAAKRSWQLLIAEKIPLLLAALAVTSVTFYFLDRLDSTQSVPLDIRVKVALSGYLSHLEKTFWPVGLAVLYPWTIPPLWHVVLGAMVVGGITLLAFYLRYTVPAVIVGWFWFLGTMVPLSGIVHIGPQAWADRFTYLPHIGLFIALVWGIGAVPFWRRAPVQWQAGLVGAVLLVLGVLTWVQATRWRNSETLFLHTIEIADSALIRYSLGSYYDERGDLQSAAPHYERAAALQPTAGHLVTFGYMQLAFGKYEEAARTFQLGLRDSPDNADLQCLLGVACFQLNKLADARHHLQQAFRRYDLQREYLTGSRANPHRAEARVFLGRIELREGNVQQAIADFTAALRYAPGLPPAYQWLGIAHGRAGHWREAEAALRQAVAVDPEDPLIRGYLARALARLEKEDEAAREYAVLRQHPEWLSGIVHSALELAARTRIRDIPRARELAEQVCAATDFKDAAALDALAAVQAAEGDFVQARKTASMALALALGTPLAVDIQQHLNLYEQGRPLSID